MKEGEILRPCKEFVHRPEDFMVDRGGMIMEALILAMTVHDGEKRKTPPYEDYVEHCVAVASILESWGGSNEEELVAALLHDSIENHPDLISLENIREFFWRQSGFFGRWSNEIKIER